MGGRERCSGDRVEHLEISGANEGEFLGNDGGMVVENREFEEDGKGLGRGGDKGEGKSAGDGEGLVVAEWEFFGEGEFLGEDTLVTQKPEFH